jgi:glycosyltransferase involved in cell wall biosynthesis
VDAGLDFRLVLIGDGPLKTKLQDFAAEQKVPVEFPGFISSKEVKQWLNRAAIAAVPSVTASDGDSEGLPTIVIEAQAMGVPVVGTIHSGIPEGIQDNRTGYLVPERDIVALAKALRLLLEDTQKRTQFGHAARQFILDQFSMDIQVKGLEDIYTDAIHRASTVPAYGR